VRYVLDASAILRYLDDEPGAARVAELIEEHLSGRCEVLLSAVHWGEVAGVTCKVHGRSVMDLVLSRLEAFGLQVIPAAGDRAVRAALLKVKTGVPYVDAFGLELTSELGESVFVTADFDFKPAVREVKIEFLPAK
jgi:predicted nucleic acid-binding protein